MKKKCPQLLQGSDGGSVKTLIMFSFFVNLLPMLFSLLVPFPQPPKRLTARVNSQLGNTRSSTKLLIKEIIFLHNIKHSHLHLEIVQNSNIQNATVSWGQNFLYALLFLPMLSLKKNLLILGLSAEEKKPKEVKCFQTQYWVWVAASEV